MTHTYISFIAVVFVLFIYLTAAVPSAAAERVISQPIRDALEDDPGVLSGSRSQTLGSGISGRIETASFPISFKRSPSYGPHFHLSLDAYADENYEHHVGSQVWGWSHATVDPYGIPDNPVDAILTFTNPDESHGILKPEYFYRIGISMSYVNAAGTFRSYGSAEDTYPFGEADARGLADLAFTLTGVSFEEHAPEEPEDPSGEENSEPTSHVSNVLFLPGLKGSRLYRESSDCEGPVHSCAIKLWEPYGHPIARQLFLDESGRSVHGDMYARAGDVLSAALSQKFYSSFFDMLEERRMNGAFGPDWRWNAAAYDWRLSLSDIVNRGTRYDDRIYYTEGSGPPYIETLLRELAASSPTGKVTIVAHSNGGLVAKALMQKIGSAETAALIDNVVFVGVPQSGAPQALGALLFGHGEALPFDRCADWGMTAWLCGLLIDRATAREFAEHAPAAYHLLPSTTYFQNVSDAAHPVATFNASTHYARERERYGATIDTADELRDFLLARDGGRDKPAASDVTRANVLSETLLAYAHDAHATLAAWAPPEGVEIYQIAGWGNDTVAGIEFYEEPRVLGLFGGAVPRYRPIFVEDGDGVVPAPSALMMSEADTVQRFWVNLSSANFGAAPNISHKDLFELDEVQHLIQHIVAGTALELPRYVTRSRPATLDGRKKLIFFLHSPLTLELYDESGNRTGENDDEMIEEGVPGTTYGEFGEVKYIIAPAGQRYTLRLRGKGEGTFSLDVQELEDGQVTRTSTIAGVPAAASTIVTLTIADGVKSASPLSIDHDGDGETDIQLFFEEHAVVEYFAEPEPEREPEIVPEAESEDEAEGESRPEEPMIDPETRRPRNARAVSDRMERSEAAPHTRDAGAVEEAHTTHAISLAKRNEVKQDIESTDVLREKYANEPDTHQSRSLLHWLKALLAKLQSLLTKLVDTISNVIH